jgi:RNA polymerase sigma-70 factor, ECF subfamily
MHVVARSRLGTGRGPGGHIVRSSATDAGASGDGSIDGESATAERGWVDGIRHGDPRALESLVRAYAPRLVRLAFGLVHDGAEAEDIVQDVFWRIWDGRATWEAPTSLRAYLYTAVRNRALNALERRRVREQHAFRVSQSSASDPDLVSTPDPADAFMAAESNARMLGMLRGAFLRLTERQQTALRLRYEEALTHREVAAALNVTHSAAEQLLGRAIHALRVALKRRDEE